MPLVQTTNLGLKRILYRCGKCGTSENGIILSDFVKRNASKLGDPELVELEKMLHIPEPILFQNLVCDESIDKNPASIMNRIRNYIKENYPAGFFASTAHKQQ